MSDILNHYYCARETYKLLHSNKDIIELINKYFDAFRLGSQGPDFFYYNILSKDAKTSHKIGSLIHTQKINKFFYYGLKFAEKNPEYKEITLVYLMGFISHFELDTITHPFIFYRTGTNSDNPEEIKISKGLHKLYEVLLDTAMMQYEYNKLAVNQNPEKVFYVKPFTLEFLESFYQYIIKKVFDISLSKNTVKRALFSAGFLVNQFKDQSGKKHKLVETLEKLIKQDHLISRFLYPSYTNEFDILNLDNQTWFDPETGKWSNTSYPELYFKAAEQGSNRIMDFMNLVNKNEVTLEDINNIFENRSYLTGNDSELGQTQQFTDKKFKNNLINNY